MFGLLLSVLNATPSPAPSCAVPDRDAFVTTLVQPQYPRGYYTKEPVQVVVQLTIGPDGTITGGHVVQSSGIAAFDGAVVSSAEQSRFAPKLINCQPVEGTYLFKVTFKT